MKPFAPIAATAVAILGVACTGDGTPDDIGMAVRDSAGVTIVEHAALDPDRELLLATGPVVEIGVVDGAEEFQFFRVSDARRLTDGGFAVADGGSRELRIYDEDGSHRATAGGRGDGPTEFSYPIAIRVLAGDTILVQDRTDRVYFTSAGEFVRRATTSRQDMADLTARTGGNSEGGQWMADGTFFAPIYQWDADPLIAGPPFRPSMTFVRVSGDLRQVDTLGTFGGILQQYVDIGEERPSGVVPPYYTNTSWGLGSADGTIVAADNAVPQVELYTPDGDHTIVRWRGSSASVTAAEVEAWKDLQRGASWTQGQLPELERAWAELDIPAVKPFYGRAAAGSDGRVWLGPVDEDGIGWWAFEPDGRFAGVAAISAAFSPMDSGPGWLLGIYRDENEVEFLRLYTLVE